MPVQTWWSVLSIVAVLNIVTWIVSAVVLIRRHGNFSSVAQSQRWMLWLSAVYVAGCAFRSILPRIDLERLCVVQSELSNIMVGRSVATLAELCFVAQGALLLYQAGRSIDNRFVKIVSLLLIPMIIVAECASWYAILSKNYFGHVLENSIWTFSAILLLASFVILWPHSNPIQRRFLTAIIIFGICYIAFMTTIDVPMYWSRWHTSLANKIEYLSLAQGILDASRPCVVSFSWNIWRMEIPWMTLYFTVAVWLSISLAHVPGWINGTANRNNFSESVEKY